MQGDAECSKKKQASELVLSELGCLLGGFRDVAEGIGMDVMAVTIDPVPKGEAERRPCDKPMPLPKGTSRNMLKLITLIQTFSDSLFHVGYILSSLDLKETALQLPNERKTWNMKVTIGGGRS